MGCGSSVAQVSDSIKEGLFRPVRLLEVEREGEAVETEGRVFLFGETRTQRKILEVELAAGLARSVSTRVRIPVPRITYDPIELLYEESQEIFHLGAYGLSVQPPFNRMLALFLQHNVVFLCGGRDFDGYNIKNEAFYYSIVDESKEGELARTETRQKYSANKFQKVASMLGRRYGHIGIYIQKLKSVLVFGGINDKEEIINSCQRYGVLDNVWKECKGMNVARAYGSCFHFGNKVYVFGGRSSISKKSKKIEVFDLETLQWEILPFKIHRGIEDALIASQHPNEILIIGGKTHSGATKSVIKVDILNQSYVWDSALNNEYLSVKGVKTRSEIIVFGGAKNTMEVYAKGQWTAKNFDHRKFVEQEQMEIFSFTTQSIHVGGRKPQPGEQGQTSKEDLILFGNDECPCLLACDLKTGEARKCSASMKCKIRSKMAVVQYEKGKYFLAGGCDWKEKKSYSSCYFYNADTQQTQETVKMNEKKHNFATCVLNGFIYIFGGYDSLDKTAKKSCAKFSLTNEGWDLLPTMRRARNRCHCQAINSSKIAVFGGVSGNDPVFGIEIFNILEKKFDIYEPTLELPSDILCTYTVPNNQQAIIILNRGEGEAYELITVCLGENPQNMSRSTTSNNVVAVELGEPSRQESGTSSQAFSGVSSVDRIIVNQQPLEGDNIIRVKPKLVQIQPKKLESESSQMNLSQNKEEAYDIDSSFHLEKIDLKKNKTEKLKIQIASEAQEVKQQAPEKEKKQKIDNFMIEKESPIELGNTEINHDEMNEEGGGVSQISAKEPEAKIAQPVIQEQFKLISSKPVDWLPKGELYLAVPRLDHIYFVTNSACIQLDRSTGKAVSIEFKNSTGVPLEMMR